MTSVICKIYGVHSIVRDHVIQYFISNNFLSNKQYGFIKGGRPTVIQLLKILDDWTEFGVWRANRLYIH